jgi:hypothetical protein
VPFYEARNVVLHGACVNVSRWGVGFFLVLGRGRVGVLVAKK